jgi:hypothetical protein
LGDNYDFYNSNALRNPFKGYLIHPVEANLMRAKLASDRQNQAQFKNERANILEFPENQYQHISAASTRVIDFVKTEKKVGELLDAESRSDPVQICYDSELTLEKIGEAMTLVEEYAEAFKRDMPMEMKKEIRLHQRLFDSFYSGSTCKNFLWQLREAFDIGDWRRFVNLFRSTVSNLDAQYLSILRARKNLFEEDDLSLESVGSNIDAGRAKRSIGLSTSPISLCRKEIIMILKFMMNLVMEIKKLNEARIGKDQKERVRAAKQSQLSRKTSMRRVREAQKMA